MQIKNIYTRIHKWKYTAAIGLYKTAINVCLIPTTHSTYHYKMSKHITKGPWHLRFVIVDKETHVLSFLTSNGVGKIVTVEPGIEPPKQRVRLGLDIISGCIIDRVPLQWYAIPVEGKKDWYKIIQDLGSICPPGLARLEGSDKVILSEQPDEWRLEYVPINVSNGDVFKSVPLSNFTFVLGTNFLHKNSSPTA